MNTLENKLIIYDSNCRVCSSLRSAVLKLTKIPPAKIVAYKDLLPIQTEQVDADKFRNGMAVIDLQQGDTIYGSEGIAYIFSTEYKAISFLLRVPLFHRVFDFLYKTVAYNRYITATPKSSFACDCFPDRVLRYRISYIIITMLLATVLTAVFGISLRGFFPGLTASAAAMSMLLLAGTGWALQIILVSALSASRLLSHEKALDYIGHLGTIMVAGLLILVPWMLFYLLTGYLNPYLPVMSVAFSSGYMLYMHVKRVKHLGLSSWWTISWFIFLQLSAVCWVYILYFKDNL